MKYKKTSTSVLCFPILAGALLGSGAALAEGSYANGGWGVATSCETRFSSPACDSFHSEGSVLDRKRKVKPKDIAEAMLDGMVLSEFRLNFLGSGGAVRMLDLDNTNARRLRVWVSVFYDGGGVRLRAEDADMSLLLKKTPNDVDDDAVFTGVGFDMRW